jgi:hypothetical protein
MVTALSQIWGATCDLMLRFAATLRRSWRQLLALMLLGWAGIYGAELLAVLVIKEYPWATVPILAAGIVAQLVAVVLALRWLIATAGNRKGTGRFTEVLTTTLVPFFLVYAGFGMVDDFLAETLRMAQTMYGASLSGDLADRLDPFSSFWTLLVIVFIIIGVFTARELLTARLGKNPSLPLALTGGLISGGLVLLVLLSGNQILSRISRELTYQYHVRSLYDWVLAVKNWMRGVIGDDALAAITGAIHWVTDTLAPLAWDVLLQPLAWLALTTIVAGRDLLSAADYLALSLPRKLRRKTTYQVNSALARVRDFALDTFDDQVVTRLQAFRHIWRGGWPLITAVMVGFGTISLVVDLVERLLERWYAPYGLDTFAPYQPLVGLVPKVLGLGLQLALVAVAFVVADSGVPASGRVRRPVLTALLGVAISLGMAAAAGQIHTPPAYLPVSADATLTAEIGGTVIRLETAQATRRINDMTRNANEIATTELAFVVVMLAIGGNDVSDDYRVVLEAGGRTYLPYNATSTDSFGYIPFNGFVLKCAQVFEVDPAALDEPMTLTVSSTRVSFGLPQPQAVFRFQVADSENLDQVPTVTVPRGRLELP